MRALNRVVLGVFLNYICISALITAVALLIEWAGWMPKANALIWAMLVGFITFPIILIWSFLNRKPVRVWITLVGASAFGVYITYLLGGDPTFGFK